MRISLQVIACVLLLCSCGSGSSSSEAPPTTLFEGSVVDRSGNPLADVEVYIFETYESSITDQDGTFSLESYKQLPAAGIFFKREGFTNTVQIGAIPDDTLAVVAGFMIDTESDQAELIGVEFQSISDGPVVPPTPNPGTTPQPGNTPAPGGTPTPNPTATPKPSNFDANGNTTAFGIPKGMTGNINKGSAVWGGQCASCHGVEKKNRSYGQIKNSFNVVPTMRDLPTTTQQMADVTAYLNRGRK